MAWGPKPSDRTSSPLDLSLLSLAADMGSESTQDCGPVTGPITDSATYTYSYLNTGFTPAKSCLDVAYRLTPAGYDSVFTWVDTMSAGGNFSTSVGEMRVYRGRDPKCFPSKYPKACEWQGTVQQQQNYVYSPGMCPGGYASATTSTDESATTVTTATCCPSGYALSSVVPNIGQTFWGDRFSCTSVGSSVAFQEATTTFPPDVLTLYAPTVVVAWQSSDLARWKTALPTATSTGSLGSSETPSGGLSTGAKAGIGVGCAVVVIAAAVISLVLFRIRSRKRRASRIGLPPLKEQPLDPMPVKNIKPNAELADEVALQEMNAQGRLPEADHLHTRAELM